MAFEELRPLKGDIETALSGITGVQVEQQFSRYEVLVNRTGQPRAADDAQSIIKGVLDRAPYSNHYWRIRILERSTAFTIISVVREPPPPKACKPGQWSYATASYGDYYREDSCLETIFDVMESFRKDVPDEWFITYRDGLLQLEAEVDSTTYYFYSQKPEPANDQP